MSEAPVKAPKGEPKDTSTINKIRTENRERKKRWREANEDRSKYKVSTLVALLLDYLAKKGDEDGVTHIMEERRAGG